MKERSNNEKMLKRACEAFYVFHQLCEGWLPLGGSYRPDLKDDLHRKEKEAETRMFLEAFGAESN